MWHTPTGATSIFSTCRLRTPKLIAAGVILSARISVFGWSFAASRFVAMAAFLFEARMFGLFKSVVDLTTDVAQVVAAPVEIVAD